MTGLLISNTLTTILLFYSLHQGLTEPDCWCQDKTPPDFTCDNQVAWGKCEEDWMVSAGYCDLSCGRCSCDQIQDNNQAQEKEQAPTTSTQPTAKPDQKQYHKQSQQEIQCSPKCIDIKPPTSEFECPDLVQWDKCEEDWMKGYCLASCKTCIQCPEQDNNEKEMQAEEECSSKCIDMKPATSEFECSQLAKWDKCEEDWMSGFCLASCKVCKQCPQQQQQNETASETKQLNQLQAERKANTNQFAKGYDEVATVEIPAASYESKAVAVRQSFADGELAQDYEPFQLTGTIADSYPYSYSDFDSHISSGFEVIFESANMDSQFLFEQQFLLQQYPPKGCTPLELQLTQMPDLSLFVGLLYQSDFMSKITAGDRDLTLFVPTNFAVDSFYRKPKLNRAFRNLKSNFTANLLKYHVVDNMIAHMDLLENTQNKVGTWLNNEKVSIQTVTSYVPNNHLCRGKYCDNQGNKVKAVSVMDSRENKVQVVASLFNACRVTVHIVNQVLLPSSLKILSN
eukprot:TRINITY_DN8917_c1_g1_i4.p1 TRINITY_DN8917_c1_g1~~TRINITY_DN8917_c1_g1_i4.p1  ORF type:complete len:512 (-),score=53.08 TRINITY_DN8917_c1_g1_i4:497-2032(-)